MDLETSPHDGGKQRKKLERMYSEDRDRDRQGTAEERGEEEGEDGRTEGRLICNRMFFSNAKHLRLESVSVKLPCTFVILQHQ